MTPQEFHEQVLPLVVREWDAHCFCASPGFRKLVSFHFGDYGIGPAALADSEILIAELILARFLREGEPRSRLAEVTLTCVCPQCRATCEVVWEQFSIHMDHSFVRFPDGPAPAEVGFYLTGFLGFQRDELQEIPDFVMTASPGEFLRQLKSAG